MEFFHFWFGGMDTFCIFNVFQVGGSGDERANNMTKMIQNELISG